MLLKRTKQVLCAIFGLLSLSLTLYTVVKFVLFTSKPTQQKYRSGKSQELKVAVRLLLKNTIWLVVFILQHSFQKHENVKKLWKKIGLESIERAAYNFFSSFILLQLVQNWTFVEKWTLWNISAPVHSPIWWILVITHSIFWMIIGCGSLLMDLPEIVGIKQIYYDIQGLNEPLTYKARSLNHLLSNIRHPSFIGFSLIFWLTNLMSLDRFILSLMFTCYMFVAWSPDRTDYGYQRQQFQLKKLELSYDLKQK
ncbi:CLUMA_CG004433, isoform A [Clunio marinus]|uniref:Nuclear envelope membrane protein n=1 Tax=Clunio marinus TaxID=568069 RepID=A0A1J1HRU3_9DIPT|nr:CLUMA_CG004433, isoform A [Clunio marinus]